MEYKIDTDAKGATPQESLGKCIHWACSRRGGNNFYGRIINGCGRKPSPGFNTCGVTLDKRGRYLLLWDPDWFHAQTPAFQVLVIVHEAGHLVLRHIERFLTLSRPYPTPVFARLKHVMQIAADFAVNDTVVRPLIDGGGTRFKEFYDATLWPEKWDFERGLSFDEYFHQVLHKLGLDGWTAYGEPSGDGNNPHGFPQWFQDMQAKGHPKVDWMRSFNKSSLGEIDRAIRRAEREARKITQTAVQQTKKSCGSIPGELSGMLEDLLAEPTIPWTAVFYNLIKSRITSKLNESTMYPNVALLHNDEYEPYPGYQSRFSFNIVAAFDTSGSMGDDEVAEAYRELLGVLETEDGVSVHLVHFDSRLQHEEVLTSDSAPELRRNGAQRHGYGGTDFSPPLRYFAHNEQPSEWVHDANREKGQRPMFDLALLFTDGEAPIPLPELEPPMPLTWIITSRGAEQQGMRNVMFIR